MDGINPPPVDRWLIPLSITSIQGAAGFLPFTVSIEQSTGSISDSFVHGTVAVAGLDSGKLGSDVHYIYTPTIYIMPYLCMHTRTLRKVYLYIHI